MKLAIALAVSLVSSVALAQPGQTPQAPTPVDATPATPTSGAPMPVAEPPPPPPPVAVMPPPPPPPRGGKSAGVGVALGIAGTIVPAVAFGIGIEMDDTDIGSRVAVVSLVGGLVLPSAGMYYAGHKKTIGQYPRAAALVALVLGLLIDGLGDSKEAGTYYAVSGGLYVIGSGIDIAMTPGAVADYNARRAAPPVVMAPMAVRGGGGLVVGGAF